MDQADRDRIQELCSLIAVEQDREQFLGLVEELNRILEAKDVRLRNSQPGQVPAEGSTENLGPSVPPKG